MVDMPSVGKRVKLVADGPAGSTSHEGVVLPGAAPNHITVKLVNGYNVSYPLDMVKTIEEIGFGDQRKKIYEDGSVLEDETLKNLIDGLSNSMVGLSWEDCEVGEELTVNPDHL